MSDRPSEKARQQEGDGTSGRKTNIFDFGLDPFNRKLLERVRDADT